MSESEYSVFQTFTSHEEALELNSLLIKSNLKTKIHDSSTASTTIVSTGNTAFSVYVHEKDFIKANEILEEEARKAVKNISKDHYLFEFTNDELYEILFKKDEWSQIDFLLAQHILKERGEEINQNILDQFQKNRLNSLQTTKEKASSI